MDLEYNDRQHREYLSMTDRIGREWLGVFQRDTEFYSAIYWDLLTGIWRHHGPVRKTEALKFMNSIKSAHTAGKYVEFAIGKGILIEDDNPDDARSKLVRLSEEMRGRLDAFFDRAVGEVRKSNNTIHVLGPSPEQP